MFSLAIMIGSGQWRLMFRTEDKALTAVNLLDAALINKRCVQVIDEFGQTFSGMPLGWLLEDMDKSQGAAVELALHNARTQKKATTMAQSDPALKQSMIGQPGIVAPMGRPQF